MRKDDVFRAVDKFSVCGVVPTVIVVSNVPEFDFVLGGMVDVGVYTIDMGNGKAREITMETIDNSRGGDRYFDVGMLTPIGTTHNQESREAGNSDGWQDSHFITP